MHSVIDQFSKTEDDSQAEKNVSQKTNIVKPKDKDSGTLKGKRKDLSMAMRKMIDAEQDAAVKLYKQMKKDQRAQNKT